MTILLLIVMLIISAYSAFIPGALIAAFLLVITCLKMLLVAYSPHMKAIRRKAAKPVKQPPSVVESFTIEKQKEKEKRIEDKKQQQRDKLTSNYNMAMIDQAYYAKRRENLSEELKQLKTEIENSEKRKAYDNVEKLRRAYDRKAKSYYQAGKALFKATTIINSYSKNLEYINNA